MNLFLDDVSSRLRGGSRVLLDLGDVTYLDSSGCAAILNCWRRVGADRPGRGCLMLCGLSPEVRSIVELVRIHRILDIYETRSEALRAFGTNPRRESTPA